MPEFKELVQNFAQNLHHYKEHLLVPFFHKTQLNHSAVIWERVEFEFFGKNWWNSHHGEVKNKQNLWHCLDATNLRAMIWGVKKNETL